MTPAAAKTPDPARARLYRLKPTAGGKAGENGKREIDGPAIELQFNPATLRLQRQGTLDKGGVTAGTSARQHTGVGKATLSFDVEFDTTEEGDGSTVVDVRTLTQPIRQFVEPPGPNSRSTSPPAALFEFGTFRFAGVVRSVGEEIDYFLPPHSTPARAKVSVSMEGLDDLVETAKAGPGARTDKGSTPPGKPPAAAAAGGSATKNPDHTETARNGESAAQLAARIGGNPAAWRSLDIGPQANPLSIPPGTQVAVGPELQMPTTAVGQAAGFAAAPAPGPEQLADALSIPAGPAPSPAAAASSAAAAPAASAPLDPGFALTAAGGITAAAAQVAAARTQRSADAVRAAFPVPPAPPSADGTADAATASQLRLATAVDRRGQTYGQSVPLREAVTPRTRIEAAASDVPSVASLARPLKDAGTDPYGTPSWARGPGPGRGGRP